MSRISTSQKPSPMNSQLFCGKKTTNFGFRVGAGRGGAAKDILKQLSPNLQNFKIHGRFFLSFFFTSSGSGKSPDPKIHEHFSCLCLSLSRTRTHAHASSSRASFSRLLRQFFKGFRSIASSAEAGHNSRQLSLLFFFFFFRPHPQLYSFFFLLLFFSFLFFLVFFFRKSLRASLVQRNCGEFWFLS